MTRLLIVALTTLIAGSAVAQDSTSSERKTFLITEAAYFARIPTRVGPFDHARVGATVDLSVAHKLSSRLAVGITGSAGLLSQSYVAIKPRVRLWVSPAVSLDVAPGVVLTRGPPSLIAEASIMYRDRIGFSVQGFSNPDYTFENGSTVRHNRFDLFAGVRLGSKPGLVGIAGDALAFLVVIGAYLITCRNGCD